MPDVEPRACGCGAKMTVGAAGPFLARIMCGRCSIYVEVPTCKEAVLFWNAGQAALEACKLVPPAYLVDFPKVANFKQEEFACKCGCGAAGMKPSFILKLQEARVIAGVPFVIRSGFRCRQHNLDVGALKSSSHSRGYAADIEAKSSYNRFRLVRGCIRAGFTRIGIGKDFVHVDSDRNKPGEVIWLYPQNQKARR